MKKKKMKNRTKILIAIFIYILLLTISYTIIFCYKNTYPTEIYMAQIPVLITEFLILFKLKQGADKNERN